MQAGILVTAFARPREVRATQPGYCSWRWRRQRNWTLHLFWWSVTMDKTRDERRNLSDAVEIHTV